MKTKILVLAEPGQGGEWIATSRLINSVKKLYDQYEFYLIAFGDKGLRDIGVFKKAIFIKHNSSRGLLKFMQNILSDFLAVRKKIKIISNNTKIDFVFGIHSLMFLSAVFVLSRPIKFVFMFHGIKTIFIKKLSDLDRRQIFLKFVERVSLWLADVITVPSLFAKFFLIKISKPIMVVKKIALVPNFVPDMFLRRLPLRQILACKVKLKIPTRNIIVLYSGRVVRFKGLENLIESFLNLLPKYKKVTFVIASPFSSSDQNLIIKIRKAFLNVKSDQLKLVFDSNLEQLKAIYQMSDVMVLPSDIEMAPLSVMESLSSGTPVIGTNTGNIKELIWKIDKNLILKDNSVKEIEKSLKYLLSLSGREKQTLRRKSLHVAASYSEKNSVRSLLKVLRSASAK